MEQVDIVDKNLQIIGTVSKEKAHDQGLLHKTVIAEVINSKGEMLLVRQAIHKQDAGQYVSPVGGHVSAGENNKDALLREAEEEIGLKDFTYRHLGNLIYDRVTRGKQENHYFIIYEIHADIKPILNDESDGFKWFSVDDINNKIKEVNSIFGDAFIPIWKKYYMNSDDGIV